MIASIHGEVQALGTSWVVVAVGGIGVRVEVPATRFSNAHVGDQIFLHTTLVVREDSLTLFGFSTSDELEVFGLLLAVSGVGPRSALGVLSALTPLEIARAVQIEDDRPFRQVSGIGPKTAKLLAVSLAGKLVPQRYLDHEASADAQAASTPAAPDAAMLVTQGLIGLGYTEAQSNTAVADAQAAGAATDHSALLRAALAILQAPRTVASKSAGGRK